MPVQRVHGTAVAEKDMYTAQPGLHGARRVTWRAEDNIEYREVVGGWRDSEAQLARGCAPIILNAWISGN